MTGMRSLLPFATASSDGSSADFPDICSSQGNRRFRPIPAGERCGCE